MTHSDYILENVLITNQMSGEVLEGFLCPLCMKDLGDVIQLQVRRVSGWDEVIILEHFSCILTRPTQKKIKHLFKI